MIRLAACAGLQFVFWAGAQTFIPMLSEDRLKVIVFVATLAISMITAIVFLIPVARRD